MASSLSPTPEYGRTPMTSMRPLAVGPTALQQAGRAARMGHRQALRRRDYGAATAFAEKAAELPEAGIGSFEERTATDFLEREAADEVAGRARKATLIADRLMDRQLEEASQPLGTAGSGLRGARGLQGATGLEGARLRGAPTAPSGPVLSPTLAQPPPVPGASQVPENPVSGAKVPMTGDVRGNLAARGGTSEPGGPTDQWRQDFLEDAQSRVTGGMLRKDAVDEINKERIAAGKAPFNRRTAIDMLHNRSQARGAIQGPEKPGPEAFEQYGRPAGPALPPATAANSSGYGSRPDGTSKGAGWLGEQKLPDGGVATEYTMQSRAVQKGGRQIDFPTLVPGLTPDELKQMTTDIIPNRRDIPEPIVQKAISHANTMLSRGQDVFVPAGPTYGPRNVRDRMTARFQPASAAEVREFNLRTNPKETIAGLVKEDVAEYEAHQKRIKSAKDAAREPDWMVGTMAGDAVRGLRRYAANWTR